MRYKDLFDFDSSSTPIHNGGTGPTDCLMRLLIMEQKSQSIAIPQIVENTDVKSFLNDGTSFALTKIGDFYRNDRDESAYLVRADLIPIGLDSLDSQILRNWKNNELKNGTSFPNLVKKRWTDILAISNKVGYKTKITKVKNISGENIEIIYSAFFTAWSYDMGSVLGPEDAGDEILQGYFTINNVKMLKDWKVE